MNKRALFGTPYGNRTHLTNVKGWCPKPIDERSINMKAILTGNSITVRQQDGRLTYPDVQTNMLINLFLFLFTICKHTFRGSSSACYQPMTADVFTYSDCFTAIYMLDNFLKNSVDFSTYACIVHDTLFIVNNYLPCSQG